MLILGSRLKVYNYMPQRESKLDLQMAGKQRCLAHSAKRDSISMKMLSLSGAFILPATFISSIFSMSFFDFIPDDPDKTTTPVSPRIWIHFAITIPITVIAVCGLHVGNGGAKPSIPLRPSTFRLLSKVSRERSWSR